MLRGHWYDIILHSVHALVEDKSDVAKDRFYNYDYGNILGKNAYHKKTQALLEASRKVGLEVNTGN
jgi:hypothetical protein